jgi:hypothetical protein
VFGSDYVSHGLRTEIILFTYYYQGNVKKLSVSGDSSKINVS